MGKKDASKYRGGKLQSDLGTFLLFPTSVSFFSSLNFIFVFLSIEFLILI